MLLRSRSVAAASTAGLPPPAITTVSLPMFSPLSVGLASNRVPLPLTPYSDAMPGSLSCASCNSRTTASVCASGVPEGSLTVISKRSCASCGIRSAPSIGTSNAVPMNAAAASPSTNQGRRSAAGKIPR